MADERIHWIPVLSATELRRELASVLAGSRPEHPSGEIDGLWRLWPGEAVDPLWSTDEPDPPPPFAARAAALFGAGATVLAIARSAAKAAETEGPGRSDALERLARGESLRHPRARLVPFDDGRLLALGWIADSASVGLLGERIRGLASTSVPVLVFGESGTGKEIVARALHRFGDRAREPWLAINCAELAEGMLESELFGHRRGAFTGALRDRDGLLAAARGGTVFLDEVGELTPSAQAKLLRVLEEHRVRPIGAESTRPIDCRIVAATNRDLAAMADEGRFRADLLYRLRGAEIALPSLRDRARDVARIADAFVTRAAIRFDRDVRGLAPGARLALAAHGWPGNVRELGQAIDAAVIGAGGPWLAADDFAIAGRIPQRTAEPLVTVRALERAHLLRALEATAGNRVAAARLLGLSRQSLARKLRRHGLVPPVASIALPARPTPRKEIR